jgi:hypothetical protein
MHDSHFDAVVRALPNALTRRTLARGLAGVRVQIFFPTDRAEK